MSTSTTNDTVKETDWVLGDTAGQVLTHAASLKACKEWIVERHALPGVPTARRTDTDGVRYIELADGMTYWAMANATIARAQGFDIPLPGVPTTYGLQPGEAALIDGVDDPALVWNRAGHIGRQPVPVAHEDNPDAWAERTAGRLRSLGITTYLGRREVGA